MTSQLIARYKLIGSIITCFSFGLGLPAASVANSVSEYQAVPPLLSESAKPLVMLAMSNDNQLFYKAFTDYDDLNGDGEADTTYTHSIDYVGYFDHHKCYKYDLTGNYYRPVSFTKSKYCNQPANNEWSGNFLNWATMTRIDEVRKVLYGGTRYRESVLGSLTVLERSFLPNDAHSFAKYYNGTDLADLTPFGDNSGTHPDVPTGLAANRDTGLTICNTTVDIDASSDNSSLVKAPPLMRVVAGNFQLWAANERWQCRYSEEKSTGNNNSAAKTGLYADAKNPSYSDRAKQRDGNLIPDYVVRVEVCNEKLLGTEQCKKYPKGNLKPVGILQRFGDSGQVAFGLVTGSYAKSKSGGVLRKNIGPVGDEINIDSDGSFIPGAGGIIDNINRFRIANYDFSSGTYNSTDNCPWETTSFLDGSCTNWGNPFSEIMLECYRYFAGKGPNLLFDADDGAIIPGITRETNWKLPLDKNNMCAQLNIIAFNASTSSYDHDQLANFVQLNPPAGETSNSMTKKIGDGEGITGGVGVNKYFIGESGADKDQLCTAKEVTNLGDVKGTCPDAPRLGGSYHVAGMAYHAHTNDIRTDLPERQTVKTYGVALAPAVPNVQIKVPGSDRIVKILPACRADISLTDKGNCGLVDFKIVKNYEPSKTTSGVYEGSFYVNWEDNEQGGDYDMDMYGMIHYSIDGKQVIVETEVVHQSTPVKMGFGFVISGTDNDGFHVMSGINEFTGFDCSACKNTDAIKSKTFNVGNSAASLLEQPLYYAAKWGGFVDRDGDGTPNLVEEWDSKNNVTGELGSDGIPDSYFWAINPEQLQKQLTNILVSILERTASGTSAAVVTNTGSGEGALYQALYNPRFAGANGVDAVEWVGTLNALFIDRFGNIREDSADPKGQLTDSDNIIDIFYNPVNRKTQVQRYVLQSDGKPGATVGSPVDVLDIQPIWSAREQLEKVTDYSSNRSTYNSKANTGRYILTGYDADGDGQIGMGSSATEVIPFEKDQFSAADTLERYRLLGMKSSNASEAGKIVNYIRGDAISGYRNRRIDLDGDGTLEPVLLGDIVHSSPLAVGRPSSGYDLTYGDDTYRAFRQAYQNRRQVVYVGANDGMLHAFNAGFFNPNTSSYDLKLTNEAEHPLGAELWAYVPYNVLPHLQWLTYPDYPHVYYVDGSIKSYDVNIFADDATHPGGWGTILIVGMRFGGGEFTLDPAEDADGDPSNDITLRSGYMIFDITDPEQPPTVLAEITHEDMGYALPEPTIVKMRAADPLTGSYETPSVNKWYVVMGSGPAGSDDVGRSRALREAVSEKTAKLFVYDLKAEKLQVHDTGESQAFVGGTHATDWSRDFIDDVVYFGTVAGSVDDAKGHLYRATFDASSGSLSVNFGKVLDVDDKPFSATPLTVRDRLGQYWVYSGTGRFYVVADNFTDETQSYYGVKEKQSDGLLTGSTIDDDDLINTSDIKVYTDGSIDSKSSPGSSISLNGTPAKTFMDVYNAVQAVDGWYFDFARYRSRNVTQAVVSDQSLVFSEYQPSGLKCEPEGYGFLNAPHMQAGIPGAFAPLGTDPSSKNADDAELVNESESLGLGSPSAPSIYQRGDGKKVAIVQNSTGELTSNVIASGTTAGRRESWRELIIDWE